MLRGAKLCYGIHSNDVCILSSAEVQYLFILLENVRYIPDVSRAVVVVLEKMIAAKSPPLSTNISTSAIIESVLQKFRDGLITEQSLSGALESSVNRLENSGASAIETGADAPTEGKSKPDKRAKHSPADLDKHFRLSDVGASAVGHHGLALKRFLPSHGTPLFSKGGDLSGIVEEGESPNVPNDLTGDDAPSIASESVLKKPKLGNEFDSLIVTDDAGTTGRWLQLSGMNAKIWID